MRVMFKTIEPLIDAIKTYIMGDAVDDVDAPYLQRPLLPVSEVIMGN